MSRITAERAATMLLELDDEWVYARQIDQTDPAPVAVLRWLRKQGLAAYRAPDRDIHPVGEWAASDIGLALADSVRDRVRSRDDLVARLARVVAGEPVENVLTPADVAAAKTISEELTSLSQLRMRRI